MKLIRIILFLSLLHFGWISTKLTEYIRVCGFGVRMANKRQHEKNNRTGRCLLW